MLTKPTKALARAVRLAAAPPILRPDGPRLEPVINFGWRKVGGEKPQSLPD